MHGRESRRLGEAGLSVKCVFDYRDFSPLLGLRRTRQGVDGGEAVNFHSAQWSRDLE